MTHGYPCIWRTSTVYTHTASQQCVRMKLPTNTELLTLLKSPVGAPDSFPSTDGGAQRVQWPAVYPSLSAVWCVGDELEMSDGLPVRVEQLWVAGRLPQGWPDGSYSSLAPHQVLGFMRPYYTQTHTVTQKHTSLQAYKHVCKHTLEADTCTFTVLEIGMQIHTGLEGNCSFRWGGEWKIEKLFQTCCMCWTGF